MGLVHTEITLKNVEDVILARNGVITPDQVRAVTVRAFADTGAWTLVLTEDTARRLGLGIIGPDSVTVAGGEDKACLKAEAVEVHWRNRVSVCRPLVLPGEDEDILGAIPMEDMDLMVCPKTQEVVGAHGDTPMYVIK